MAAMTDPSPNLTHSGTLLSGQLVRLTAKQVGDNAIMAPWSDDAEYDRLLSDWPARPESVADLERDDVRHREHPHGDSYEFMIRTLSDDRLIGFCGIRDVQWNHQTCEVGIGIGVADYRGHGYGTDAMRLLVGFAFRELNLHRITLETGATNARAIRAYQKAGFQIEVVQRAREYRDGVRNDILTMGLLRRDWEAAYRSQVLA